MITAEHTKITNGSLHCFTYNKVVIRSGCVYDWLIGKDWYT